MAPLVHQYGVGHGAAGIDSDHDGLRYGHACSLKKQVSGSRS
jgi:hypothetical protein